MVPANTLKGAMVELDGWMDGEAEWKALMSELSTRLLIYTRALSLSLSWLDLGYLHPPPPPPSPPPPPLFSRPSQTRPAPPEVPGLHLAWPRVGAIAHRLLLRPLRHSVVAMRGSSGSRRSGGMHSTATGAPCMALMRWMRVA